MSLGRDSSVCPPMADGGNVHISDTLYLQYSLLMLAYTLHLWACIILSLNKRCGLKWDDAKFTPQRWHRSASEEAFRCLSNNCLMLFRAGMNPFTQQLELYTLILGTEVGQSMQNLVRLLSSIATLLWILSTWLYKMPIWMIYRGFSSNLDH